MLYQVSSQTPNLLTNKYVFNKPTTPGVQANQLDFERTWPKDKHRIAFTGKIIRVHKFKHLIEKMPTTVEEFKKLIEEVVDIQSEQMGIKIKPEVEIKEAISDPDAAYNLINNKMEINKKFIEQDLYWVKEKSKNKFVSYPPDAGGDNYTSTSPNDLKNIIKNPKWLGIDNIEDLESVKMTDEQRLLKLFKFISHELKHRKQAEDQMFTKGIGIEKFYDRHLIPLEQKAREIDELLKKDYDLFEAFTNTNAEEVEKIKKQKAIAKKHLSKYENTIEADSKEGKLAKQIYNETPRESEIAYLNRTNEIDAYNYQREYAEKYFPEMFGVSVELARQV